MKMKIYFHDDGIPDKKKVKLELFDMDDMVGYARFDIGMFYDGEPKQVEFSNNKGTCSVHVKVLNKESYPLIDKITQGLNNKIKQKLEND
jgi:hypothetical protein